MPPEVDEVLARFPPDARERLLELRRLIFETAAACPEVGPLTETLKWGEPAYLPEKTKSGTTIRVGWKRATPTQVHLYVHCRTSLVDSFRMQWGDDLAFEGNRGVALAVDQPLPREPLQACIEAGLTYHLK